MAKFPDLPRPNSGYIFRSNWPTVGGGPEWAPQNRALTMFGLAEADLAYTAKTWAQIQVLYNFFESVNGSAGRFTFVDFNGIGPIGQPDPGVAWNHLFVAKGDGVTVTWDLPTFGMKNDTEPVVYENGVAKTSTVILDTPDTGVDYNIVVGTGTDGVDQLIAIAATAADVIITIDGICRRAMRRAKFTTVKCPFVLQVPANYQAGTLSVVEVRR